MRLTDRTSSRPPMWGWRGVVVPLDKWADMLEVPARSEVVLCALVPEPPQHKAASLTQLIKLVGHYAGSATFRRPSSADWPLFFDLYQLEDGPRLYVHDPASAKIIKAGDAGSAVDVGTVLRGRLHQPLAENPGYIIVSVHNGSSRSSVHACRMRGDHDGHSPLGSALCSSRALFETRDIVEDPITCSICLSQMSLLQVGTRVGSRRVAYLVERLGVDRAADITALGLDERANTTQVRMYNGLRRAGYHTVDDLLNCVDKDLLDIKRFGDRCLDELVDLLQERARNRDARVARQLAADRRKESAS